MEEYIKNILIGLIVLTVVGVILTSIGKFGVFGTIENMGKLSSGIGIICLIVFLIVYLKIMQYEQTERELDVIDKFLTSK